MFIWNLRVNQLKNFRKLHFFNCQNFDNKNGFIRFYSSLLSFEDFCNSLNLLVKDTAPISGDLRVRLMFGKCWMSNNYDVIE